LRQQLLSVHWFPPTNSQPWPQTPLPYFLLSVNIFYPEDGDNKFITKNWYLPTKPHSVTFQKTIILGYINCFYFQISPLLSLQLINLLLQHLTTPNKSNFRRQQNRENKQQTLTWSAQTTFLSVHSTKKYFKSIITKWSNPMKYQYYWNEYKRHLK
jgi:hypothetical protein